MSTTALVPQNAQQLALSLQHVSRETASSAAFLRMDKTGQWRFGIDGEKIESNARFIVPPTSIGHGHICWTDPDKVKVAQKLGESYVPITEPLPATPAAPANSRGWDFQLGLAMRGYEGVHEGIDMAYRTSSVGGKRAVAGLAQLMAVRLNAYAKDPKRNEFVPVITLGSDSYPHRNRSYGEIYVPIFTIVKWIAPNAEAKTNGSERKREVLKRKGRG